MEVYFPHIPPARFSERICGTKPSDVEMRRNNYALCRSIDLTSLDVVLEKMVKEDKMDCQTALIFHTQAASLLASLLTENHRLHNF